MARSSDKPVGGDFFEKISVAGQFAPRDAADAAVNGEKLPAIRNLEKIYHAADALTAKITSVKCLADGECCRFDRVEHRLFVSTLEIALLASQPAPCKPSPLRCPYQVESNCTARARRPLGCRMFFCNGSSSLATQRLYERCHLAIRHLHERCGLMYNYRELTDWLVELDQSVGHY